MRTYHQTDAAGAILARGFRNRDGYQMTDPWWRGVWLSDRPLDEKRPGAFPAPPDPARSQP